MPQDPRTCGSDVMPKIEVFMRHCFYSEVSASKNRPDGFTHEKCFENFLDTTDFSRVNLTLFLDTHYTNTEQHFIQKQNTFPIIEIDAGEEGRSFIKMLDFVMTKKFSKDTIIYFLEDDYLHREGWVDILLEGFSLPEADYITLFDHRDKYTMGMYKDLTAKLFFTKSCHWRTTPSTTNTYAMQYKTLKTDIHTHEKYSAGYRISWDHQKFLDLGWHGRTLLSPIPGWSTHCEPAYASPCYDWSRFLSAQQVK